MSGLVEQVESLLGRPSSHRRKSVADAVETESLIGRVHRPAAVSPRLRALVVEVSTSLESVARELSTLVAVFTPAPVAAVGALAIEEPATDYLTAHQLMALVDTFQPAVQKGPKPAAGSFLTGAQLMRMVSMRVITTYSATDDANTRGRAVGIIQQLLARAEARS